MDGLTIVDSRLYPLLHPSPYLFEGTAKELEDNAEIQRMHLMI